MSNHAAGRWSSGRWLFVLALSGTVSLGAHAAIEAGGATPAVDLSAAQIVEKNVAARGGLDAWRKVQTMIWIGHVQSARGALPSLPFALAQKRPNLTRFEVDSMGQKSLRLFDGTRGWKIRPKGDGGTEVKPFTSQEAVYARDAQGIDGPLIDYAAKGNSVALDGTEQIEGHRAYRLMVRLASGQSHRVWVDAQSFLEIKSDRTTYSAAGAIAGTVAVFYRDYKDFEGLQIPTLIETGVGSGKETDKMLIEKVIINPPLEDRAFTRAVAGARQRMHARAPDPSQQLSVPPVPSAPAEGQNVPGSESK